MDLPVVAKNRWYKGETIIAIIVLMMIVMIIVNIINALPRSKLDFLQDELLFPNYPLESDETPTCANMPPTCPVFRIKED